MKWTRLISLFSVAWLLLCLSCVNRPPYLPLDKKTLKGSGKIYFVPLEDFPQSDVEMLTDYYKTKYGLVIETLPSVALTETVVNLERKQLIAEAVVALIKSANANLVNDPNAILIGLTTEDMYIDKYDWQFTFSWRQEGRYAVVSNARMSLGRQPVSAEKINTRLRKMVTKNIGIMYYHLNQSDDPRSVLYRNVGGISELDRMGEDF